MPPTGIVLTQSFMEEILNNKLEYWTGTYTAEVGLFKDVSALVDCTSVLADIAEADFDGYARIAVDFTMWSPAADLGGCVWRVDDVIRTWVPTGTTHPNTIGGYFVYDTVSAKLKWWEWFSASKTIGATLAPFSLQLGMNEKRIV